MENRVIITIGRQIGSGGISVAKILAERLHIKLYDRELVMLAARESGLCSECFEQVDEARSHSTFAMLMSYLRTPFAGYEGGNAANMLSDEALFKIQSDVIRRAAEESGGIFVGRCADYILRDKPQRVSLFLTADEDDRIDRIMRRTECTADEARRMIEHGDERRASYYNYFTSQRWGEAATYDMTINTSRLGDAATADLILQFAATRLNIKL